MGFAASLKAIEERFAAGWALHAATYPAAYGDAPFKVPSASPWVRLTVAQGSAEQAELGAFGTPALIRYVGLVFVQVFVPQASTTRPDRVAAEVADLVAGVLQRRTLSLPSGGVVRLYETTLSRAPLLEKAGSGLAQYLIQTPYDQDEVG